jgi:hypothetical protein
VGLAPGASWPKPFTPKLAIAPAGGVSSGVTPQTTETAMASAWIENGPISLPPRTLAYGAGFAVVLLAILGAAAGFEAGSHRSTGPELDATSGAGPKDDALIAKPVVDLAPPAPPPEAAKPDPDDADAAKAKADDLAAQTAAAQAIQAKPADAGGNIDEVLTSPTEKPPAAAGKGADESPPGAPVKSDVPF